MPPGMIDPQVTDGQRRLAALQQGGFSAQEQLAYKRERTQALVQGGFSDREVQDYWGEKPNQSEVADQATFGNVVQHAINDFAAPIAGAWGGLEAQQRANWQHAFHPTVLDQATAGLPINTNTLRGAQTLWDGLGVVLSPIAGVGAAGGAGIARGVGAQAPHLTVDLKTPTSNILDPTQWTFKSDVVGGEQAAQEYGAVAGGLTQLAVGGGGAKAAVRAAPAARAAAIEAYRTGEVADPAHFPAAVVRGKITQQIQGQFPGMQEYITSARGIIGRTTIQGSAEAVNRLVKNMQDAWVATGLSPAEQAAMAKRNPIIRQQLLGQDVQGDPVTPALHDSQPPHALSHPVIPTAEAGPPRTPAADEEAQSTLHQRAVAPTFVPSVDHAMALLERLETGGMKNPDAAVSQAVFGGHGGALGRYQIMPATARQYGFDPARLHDPAYNAMAARAIVSDLFKRYDGNMDAIAIAYNAGPGRANKYLSAGAGSRLEAIPDKTVHGGLRFVRVAATKDESFLPMETQRYLANARRNVGGALSREEGAGGRIVGEAGGEAAARSTGPTGASWDPTERPASVESAAEQEARGETVGGGSLSAASAWEGASFSDGVKTILSDTGEQPRGELFPDYMKYDRLMSDYVSVLHPFEAVDKALVDKGFIEDPDRDFTTRKAFQQINGADSRMSSFILDGIVRHNDFSYTVEPGSPSYAQAFKEMSNADVKLDPGINKRDAWVATMLGKRTVHAATRDLENARIELAKAQKAQEVAAEPFNAENFDLEHENDPKYEKQRKVKSDADARVKEAQAAFEKALKQPGVDTGVNPFASKVVDSHPDAAAFDKATETYQAVKAGILQYAVDTGRLSQRAMDSMLHSDPIHISMQRVGVDSKSAGFSKLAGSDRKIVSDPIAADFSNGQWIIKQSDRNAAITYLLDQVSKDPEIAAHFGIKESAAPAEDTEAIEDALDKFGFSEEQKDEAREAFGAVIQARMDERLNPNQFSVYRDGKRVVMEVADANLARSLRAPVGPGQMEALVKGAKWVATLERSGIMAGLDWAPDIGLFHQFTQNQYDFLHPTPVVGLVEGFIHNLLNTDLAKEARASGAFSASIVDMKGDYIEHLEADLSRTGETGLRAAAKRVKDLWSDESSAHLNWNTVMWPVQAMRMMTELVDESNRTGLFVQGRRAGLDAATAGARSRNTGLDFADRGAAQVGQLLTQAAPMYQGYIKGTELGNKALMQRPASTLLWIGGTVGLATAINYGLNMLQDDDPSIPESMKWRNQPQYDKDRYMVMPVIAGQRIRVRLPSGAAGAFAAILQRSFDAMRAHDPAKFKGLITDLLQDNIRLPVPAVVNAPVEAVANHSFYTGHALIPAHLEGLAPAQQYLPTSSPASIALARVIDPILGMAGAQGLEFSPVQLDHVIAGFTGASGRALVQAVGTPERKGPPTDIATIPGISRLFERDPGMNAQLISDFYDVKQRFDAALNERAEARRQAKGEKYAEWLTHGAVGVPPATNDPLVDMELRQAAIQDAPYAQADQKLKQISSALGVMRDSAWSIYGGKESDDLKRQDVTKLYTNMIATAKTATAQMQRFEQEHPLHAR